MSAECGWCGRPTNDYIVREIETDHGPAAIVWCKDTKACTAARRKQRYALPTRTLTP